MDSAERKKVRFYHSWLLVLVGGFLWIVIVGTAEERLGGVLANPTVHWLLVIGGIAALALVVHKQRQHLETGISGPPEGVGSFVVRLPFVFVEPHFALVGDGEAKVGHVIWPNHCVGCGIGETRYHRDNFEFSNLILGKIWTKTKSRRGRKTYTLTVAYEVPLCRECRKNNYVSHNLVHLRINGEFQYLTFARPEAIGGRTGPIEYGAMFRQQNSGYYVCGYCNKPVGEAQACACGQQQPIRPAGLPERTG